MDKKIIDPANVGLVELIDLAAQLAESVRLDIEENPDAISDQTSYILIAFAMKFKEVNDALDNNLGLQ